MRGNYRVIDAHVHVIENIAGYGRKGELRGIGGGMARWIDGTEVRILPDGYGDRSFTPERLIELLDSHHVSKAVLMQGSYYGFCNDYTREAVEKFPDRLSAMGTFDPYIYESEEVLEKILSWNGFKGFKFEMSRGFGFMGYHPDFELDSEKMDKVWIAADSKRLVISLDMGTFGEPSMQTDQLKNIAEKYQGITFVIEHLFFPGREHYADLASELEKLKSVPNIYFTAASIPASIMPEDYPFPSAVKYITAARDIVELTG